ncbi:MAG: DEAD/DEAH box helicase [Bdellovibrionales bacterium]|nr:DEAD/DEAH box helicase [Bdellovibrionales bacterium]
MAQPSVRDINGLFAAVQESAAPGVWSKGVAMAREKGILADKSESSEILIKIRRPRSAVSPKVTLWPQDADWHCDCGDKSDPCVHVVAAISALKHGTLEIPERSEKPSRKEKTPAKAESTRLQYRFFSRTGYLYFERLLAGTGRKPAKLNQSLVAYMGGIGAGRIKETPPPATKEDYAVDAILGGQVQNPLDRYTLTRLLSALKGNPNVVFDDKPVEISMQTASLQARLRDDKDGFRLELVNDPTVTEGFKNGVVLSGGQLKAVRDPVLSAAEKGWFRHFSSREVQQFVSEIMPSLEAKMVVQVETSRLPALRKLKPRIVLHMVAETPTRLGVFPTLVYGDPPVAELREGKLDPLTRDEIPERNIEEEERLVKRLHNELQLNLSRQSVFENESALLFCSKAADWDRTGNGFQAFHVRGKLEADIAFDGEKLGISFNGAFTNNRRVDASKALRAWRENKAFVSLEGGGWAQLPHDWLLKYGERAEALLRARDKEEKLPRYLMTEVTNLCEETGIDLPAKLKDLGNALLHHNGIPKAKRPAGLRAELRHYQERGVDWLKFLQGLGLGAMLADDMGLGKTLQSIACIEGTCLVICPTSVLQSWADQIQQFRPELKYTIYHGSGRQLEADLVLTTYGVFRLEQELLSQKDWDMIVLDEAQTIKNPESQIARAIHTLRARFRVALSGTPIENRLDDLWSQFQFLNPGLLGTRQEFNESFQSAMRSGDPSGIESIRRKIRPFMLRRMKKEVAPELPPRTEIVLHADFSPDEESLYRSILAASRAEVMEKLESGNVLAALEMLLRLRQACLHTALVPGSGADASKLSAKFQLFFETLEESIDQGHRALVFSQWTSALDLLEPHLRERGITYNRLDGSTRNREKVVADFQRDDGPRAMLISLKAGGVGITLTAADHIYILDPWWNPAVEDQAADRAHRIGQENPVLIHRLVTRGTVEDKILALQKKKQAMAATLLENNTDPTTITRQEIMELLL